MKRNFDLTDLGACQSGQRGTKMENFKWLHLSDFHIGKDNYGQIKLFDYILEHIKDNKDKGNIPDAVFITGDIANNGCEEQYRVFSEDFLLRLLDIYDDMPRIYIVPGNHDIDRNQCMLAAGSLYSVLNEGQNIFFDTDKAGFTRRKEILNRFSGFQNGFISDSCFPVKDIFEEKGYFTDIFNKKDKKVGIIGINTAWLSNSKEDKEKLTPGKYMLEEALKEVKDCNYKLVLGHHPLSWLQCEQRQQISALLAKNKAMYLHGHMHKNSGECSLAFNIGFLTLQCGAAFQAREDEKYYNSLQWGEFDFHEDAVRVMPKKWSVSQQKFIADSSENWPDSYKEEGKDSWLFPYLFSIPNKKAKTKEVASVRIPTGWHLIDEAFIKKRKEPQEEEILKYFDGKEPSYNEIFSSFIPVREAALNIKKEFIRCDSDNKIKCALITGAGGEGKTTALLQIVRMLVEEDKWKALVLRQAEKDLQFNAEQILNITKKGNWIICADNCFPITDKLFELLKRLANRENRHVHLLLCARDIDWNNSESGKLPWREHSDYSTYKLRGIDEGDAKKIVSAWERLGERGLGKLKDLSLSEATEKLILSSQDEEKINGPDEGALLGAMLATRYGDELHSHVRNMLLRLQTIPVGSETLLYAFAYIVAMHSEKLYFLSKTVLAQIYNYELKDVKKYILGPLGEEAASAVNGDMIYTRHISIARSARRILDEEFHFDFDEIFIELASAAAEAVQKGEYVEKFAKWKFISDNFSGTNNTLAIRLDRKILDIDPYDPYMIVHLSKKYREVEQPELALDLFRKIDYETEHRPLFCEWALVEAHVGNKATSVCLSALALSDQAARKQIDVRNACINLYSIALTFKEMYSQFKNEKYLWAELAAIKLGEKIDKDDANMKKLISANQDRYKEEEFKKNGLDWKKCLQKGILTAAAEKEISFQKWIPQIENLEYKKVFSLAGIVL